MNKLFRNLVVFFSLILLCTVPVIPVMGSNETFPLQKSEIEETFQKGDLYITVSLYEEKKPISEAKLSVNAYEKKGRRTYTATNADGKILFTFSVEGIFSVNPGVSATCTEASYSYSISSSAWELHNASAYRSGNQAIADGEFVKKLLGITIDTFNAHIVLSCDANGNLS